MMAVVTLNRLVFEQAVAQVLERVQSAVRDFERRRTRCRSAPAASSRKRSATAAWR